MNRLDACAQLRLILAICLPVIAGIAQWIFWPTVQPLVWFLFYPAVFASSSLGGLSGGLVATGISDLLVIYFFIPPQLSWTVQRPEAWYSVFAFTMMGILFSLMQNRLLQTARRMTAALETARIANQQLQTANAEITRLYDQTRELDELKSRFFANVSHELRTPLTLILGPVTKHLARTALADELRHDLQVVERNTRLLYRHVTDLLDVAKIDAGKATMQYAGIDLAVLVRFVASHFDVLAQEKQIRVTVLTPPDLPAQVDPEKCQRIFLNLPSNAFKFTPEGGVIALTLSAEQDRAAVEIQDTGPGVPAEMREAIFERFRQVDSGDNRNYGGTGLGLAIVKDFVELHMGAIAVADGPGGGGARFTVTLPLRAPLGTVLHPAAGNLDFEINRQTVEELRLAPAPEPAAGPVRQAPLVLIVEDNHDMNAFLAETLGKSYRVMTAYDGEQGIAQALATRPDLILSDVMMPRLSGDQMVTELRRHPEMRDTPVVLLTAKADDALRVRMLQQGVQDYIDKPFSADELLARVAGLIQRHRQNREMQARLAAIVESSEDAIIGKSLDGVITSWNRGAEYLFGYTAEEALGKSILMLFPPERVDEESAILDKIAHGESVKHFETVRVCRDERRLDVSVTISPIKDERGAVVGISKIARDITERKHAEETLRASEDKYRRLVENAPDIVYVFSNRRGGIYYSPRAETALGYPLDYLYAHPFLWNESIHPDDRARVTQTIQESAGGKAFAGEYRVRDAQGNWRWFYDRSTETHSENGETLIEGLATDITERKQREREMQAVAQMSVALRVAETRAEMLSVIASQVSELVDAASISLLFYDDRARDYVIEYAVGEWRSVIGRHLSADSGILQYVLTTGKPYVTNDLPHDPYFTYRHIIGEMRALAEIPLFTHQKTIGFVAVARRAPFSGQDVQVLEAISNIAANALHRVALHEQAIQATAELTLAYDRTLEGWAHALELRDQETEFHTRRVVGGTLDLAHVMGIGETELEQVRRGALLHDIGKMGVPDSVLLKPGTLTEREWELMRRHPEYAYNLLAPIEFLRPALDIPYCHHEKWDGTGYPRGLRGEEIPLAARIFAVIDVWDALRSNRPYRLAWPHAQTIDYIRKQAGKHFDPQVVAVFMQTLNHAPTPKGENDAYTMEP
ncbi:MAG: PAS domain S-box protein [Anaerolineae bacterium]